MVILVNDLKFSYKNKLILKNINFKIKSSEVVAILGPNGSGKTTLMKCLNKILEIDEGTILINKNDINNISSREIAKQIGYVPQNLEKGYLTVYDYVLLGRRPYIEWNLSKEDFEKINDILKILNLETLALQHVNELSGGELQKVAIARALAQNPKILLLDEPNNGLDLKNQIEIMNIIKKISTENNISSIVIIHDLNLAIRYCNKFIMIKNSEILDYGNINKLKVENISEAYGVDVMFYEHKGIPYIIPIFD